MSAYLCNERRYGMEDILIEMLEEARKRLDIHPKVLCRGICTEEMYYMVLDEKRTIDRVTIKRLLSRLGVDNGNYEHFLENEDYEIWRGRMNIINAIEKNLIEEAKKLLKEYGAYDKDDRNVNRANVDKQFCIFMELQIMRHIDKQDYESKAKYMYGEALRQTVTYIEEMPMNDYLLSPLEFNLYFEYERRKADCSKDNELLDLYKKFFKYIMWESSII